MRLALPANCFYVRRMLTWFGWSGRSVGRAAALFLLWISYAIYRNLDSDGFHFSYPDLATAFLQGIAGVLIVFFASHSGHRMRLFQLAAASLAVCAAAAIIDEVVYEPVFEPDTAREGLTVPGFWYSFSEVALFALAAVAVGLAFRRAPQPVQTVAPVDTVWIPIGRARRAVNPQDIVRLSADRDYTRIHMDCEEIHASASMSEMLALLPKDFVRIHRSHAVNVRHIEEVGSRNVMTSSGAVPVGRSYQEALARLGHIA